MKAILQATYGSTITAPGIDRALVFRSRRIEDFNTIRSGPANVPTATIGKLIAYFSTHG
jgi:hypothetical protein